MTRTRCDRTPAWAQLEAAYQADGKDFDLRDAFAADPQRFAQFSQAAPLVFADLSKNRIDAATQELLFQLARESGLLAHRDAMFAGEVINTTEQREVWHTLLRAPADATTASAHEAQALAQVHGTLDAMLAFAEAVRADGAIADIVNIGIGQAHALCQQRGWARDGRYLGKAQSQQHAVFGGQQDLHHHRDHDQRPVGQALVYHAGRC